MSFFSGACGGQTFRHVCSISPVEVEDLLSSFWGLSPPSSAGQHGSLQWPQTPSLTTSPHLVSHHLINASYWWTLNVYPTSFPRMWRSFWTDLPTAACFLHWSHSCDSKRGICVTIFNINLWFPQAFGIKFKVCIMNRRHCVSIRPFSISSSLHDSFCHHKRLIREPPHVDSCLRTFAHISALARKFPLYFSAWSHQIFPLYHIIHQRLDLYFVFFPREGNPLPPFTTTSKNLSDMATTDIDYTYILYINVWIYV